MPTKIKNYSTKQQASTSIARIHSMLVDAGARAVHFRYDEHRRVAAIEFSLETELGMSAFQAPCHLDRLAALLHQHWKDGTISKRIDLDLDQVERIVLKGVAEWLHVTISLWTTGLYTPSQALFGWMLNPADGVPVFDMMMRLALPKPEER